MQNIKRTAKTDCTITLLYSLSQNCITQFESLPSDYADTINLSLPTEKFIIKDVNTIMKQTSKTYATLINESYFKNQIPFFALFEQEH